MPTPQLFDAHFHIIDDAFPLVENNGYLPPTFSLNDYKEATAELGIQGGAIVSGSFQAFDQTYLIDTLSRLPDSYVGVANIPHDVTAELLDILDAHRVRAVRFNLKRGGSATIQHLTYLSDLLHERYGWHTELYVDSRQLPEIDSYITDKKRISIDHLGLHPDGLSHLYRWVEQGSKVKCTGFGRIALEPVAAMKRIHDINPSALLFGTDMPSTRADRPFSADDIDLIRDNFNVEACQRIFWANAADWYRIE